MTRSAHSLALVAFVATTLVNGAHAADFKAGLEPGARIPYLFDIPGNAAFGVIFLLLAAAHFFLLAKSKAKWTLVLSIAEVFSGLGYFLRIACRSNQQSIGLYAIANLFVILAPAAFLAFNYMMFSRLIVALDDTLTPTSKRKTPSRFTPVPPRIFGPLFVWSDVVTFLIQAGGGGLQAAGGTSALTGNKIFLAGVILQAISYITFMVLVGLSSLRLHKAGVSRSVRFLLFALFVSSILILIRSFFRIIEMAEGYGGKLYNTEVFLFTLDALPLALSNLIWVFVWPPTYFNEAIIARDGLGKSEMSTA